MKRKLFIILTLMFTVSGVWAAPPQQPQKSEVEWFVHNLAKIKSDEISYAYISANMFSNSLSELTSTKKGVKRCHS